MPKLMVSGKMVKMPYPKKGKAKGAGKSYEGKAGYKKVMKSRSKKMSRGYK